LALPLVADLEYDAGFLGRLAAAIAPVPVAVDNERFWNQQVLYYQRMMDCVALDSELQFARATGPPQQVDVVWHAHQLDAAYERDCVAKMGHALPHRPNAPHNADVVLRADDYLARAFLARFGVDIAHSACGFDTSASHADDLFARTVLQPHILADICTRLALDAAREARDTSNAAAPDALVATLAATQLELLSCVNRRFRDAVSQAPLWFECVFAQMPDEVGADCNSALRDTRCLEIHDDTEPLGLRLIGRNRAGRRVFRAFLEATYLDDIAEEAGACRQDVQAWHKRVLFLLKGAPAAKALALSAAETATIRFDFLRGIVPLQLRVKRLRFQDYDCRMVEY
jgi:hypothetical protein